MTASIIATEPDHAATSPAVERPFVVIQRNPHAGVGRRKRELMALVRRLHQRGMKPRIFRQRERLKDWMADPEHRAQLHCLVAAGGDGTIGDLVTRYPDTPLAIFPMGTENLFAKYLRIPRAGLELADLIIDGRTRRFDLARIGDRRFCVMAGVGLDADIVHQTHARRRGNIRKWQYIGPIWNAWRRSMNSPLLRITCDGNPISATGRTVFVANQPAYALGFRIADAAAGHDGRLDLRIVNWTSPWNLLWLAWRGWIGGWERCPEIASATAFRSVRIEADEPVPVQVDGDPCGFTPVEIEMIADALEVYAP